ncbi:methyltransferase, TIGR04325 family [Thalassospira sp. MCCC 1A03138]|uniref:methyltransferase, TIGR04325 family n=1 Tax=Thalassospira sp. MCCC 1A03138 TaxID=1470576 RepID=UPI000A1E7243|nr:methyltransferase, TIGR04325 family [Thalassospira sp. MCCC 1A03138]
MSFLKKILRNWMPPIFVKAYSCYFNRGIVFRGNFENWEAAQEATKGYEATEILDRVRWAAKQVVDGRAKSERDGVIFDAIPYPFPLIATLLRAAVENGNRLKVLDYGGALGSSYYQCRDFLEGLKDIEWVVVEQKNFVKIGKEEFENDQLKFAQSLAEVGSNFTPDVALISGTLQYLSNPDDLLKSMVALKVPYIVVDRTPILVNGNTIISSQIVPKSINKSEYPIRLFSEQDIKKNIDNDYEEISSFGALDGTIGFGKLLSNFKGYIFKRKNI